MYTYVKSKSFTLFWVLLFSMFFQSTALAVPEDPIEAVQTVEKKLAELLQLLKDTTIPEDEVEAAEKVTGLVEYNLNEIVDFQRIVKRIMGKHFAKATKAQRNRFLDVFRNSLIRSYSKFMLNANLQELSEKIRYQVQPTPKSRRKGRAQVSVLFKIDDKSYEAIHSMFFHTSKKRWYLENLVVGGINLGINYRTQFDRMMVKHKKDYDKVIMEWSGQKDSKES